MHPFEAFEAEATRLLQDATRALGHDGDLPALETPPEATMGDRGMPCFPLARSLKKAPPAIAQAIAAHVADQERTWIFRVEAVGPYCNLWIDGTRLAERVLADPEAALRAPATGQKILLEHTSANPNGPLHVGRARNPIVGDTLARLLRAAGHDVEVQYYMDNLGRQVALLAWGRWNLDEGDLPPVPAGRDGKPDHVLVRYYQAANERMEEDPGVKAEVQELMGRLEVADPEVLPGVREVYEACFEGMRASLARLGVHYDSVKDESDVVEDGLVEETVAALRALPRAAVEENGAHYLDLSELLKGQKDRFFFTRGDGTSVYATRDIAYHRWKARQVGEGRLVNVLGEDHRLQALQVGTALEWLGDRRPHVVFYAFVSLPEGKMSTRANRVVFLDDLLDEAVDRARAEVRARRGTGLTEAQVEAIAEAVGIAAIRFNIARVQPEKPIEFRWEDALDFEGDSAPYIMYAYARGASLLRRAAGESLPDGPRAQPGGGEIALLKTVARLPHVVQDAAAHFAPHRACAYAVQLAAAFNEYYRDHRVAGHEVPEEARLRLATVRAAHRALGHILAAIGLPTLDAM